MASYATFTSTRTTVPDPVALNAAVKSATGDGTAVLFRVGEVWRGKKTDVWTPAEFASAQSLLDTTAALTPQLEAQRFVDSMGIFDKAIVLTILDQFNLVRSKLAPPLAPITVQQMIDAIRAKAGTL